MINNWLKIFVYHLKDNKLFSVLNVLGLSLGIAGLIFAILYWNDEQSYNAWNTEKDKVFQILIKMPNGAVWAVQPAPLKQYLEKEPNVEGVNYTGIFYKSDQIVYNGKREEVDKIFCAESNFFSFFPFEIIKGDAASAMKDETSIALSEDIARRVFGEENPIGKQVKVRNNMLVVRAVYRIPGNSSIAPKMLINDMKESMDNNKDLWENYNFMVLLKLKNPLKVQETAKSIENIYLNELYLRREKNNGKSKAELIKEFKEEGVRIILEPLSSARLKTIKEGYPEGYPEGKGNYQFLLIMIGLSVLILILSIVNYVNLATANAIRRAKEVGVRKIVGALKSDIIKQFIFETILITSFSILFALAITELSLPYYNEFLDKSLVISGGEFYIQLICIFVITVMVAGIFPAIYVSNFETLKVIKGNFGRSKRGIWLRNGMLVMQFAIATFFIIGSYVVYQQVAFLSNKKLGFKGEQIITISYRDNLISNENGNTYGRILNNYNTVKHELSRIKGVEQVSTGVFKFGKGAETSSSFMYKNVGVQAQNMAIDFGMLEMLKIKMKAGRNLNEKFASDTVNSMLINETAMKRMKEINPIGKEVTWNGKRLKIVGVVNDFNLFNPQDEIPPMSFFHLKTIDWMVSNMNFIYVKLKADDMENTIANIEKFWTTKVDTEYPFKYDFVDKEYARTYETYVKQKNLFSLLNVVVIIIALFGLFALASYSIQRRMKEIAIRKTFGAETNVLLTELSKQYILFCVIGFLLALFPVYYFLTMWLENFAYRIEISVVPFIVGFVCLLSLTLVVVLSRAYQATRIDVIKYLKYE